MMSASRRAGVAVLAVAAFVTACSSSGGTSSSGAGSGGGNEGVVVVADGGGSYHDSQVKSTYEPCEKETGLKVTSTSYDYTIGPIRAQVQGAKQWDVVSLGNPMAPNLEQELLQPIDYNVVKQPGLPDSAKLKYQVVYVYFAWVPTFRTDKFPDSGPQPKNWADLWNVKEFPGPRALLNYPIGTLEIALLADGVPYNKLYPLDLKRAFAKLDQLRNETKVVWYNSGAEQAQDMANGLASVGAAWNGRMTQIQKDNAPVKYTMNQAVLQGTSWAVLKSAPHPQGAMKFIQCAASPANGARDTEDFPGNAPANLDSFKDLSSSIADKVPSNPKFKDTIAGTVDWDWWGKNFDSVYAQWQTWFAKG